MVPGLYFDPKANASTQIQNSFRRDFGRDLLSGDSGTIGNVLIILLAGSTGEAPPPQSGRPTRKFGRAFLVSPKVLEVRPSPRF